MVPYQLLSGTVPYQLISVQLSVMSDALWPHGLQPARLPCPWHFLGKDTGVGCHLLLQWTFSTQGLTWISCIGRQILYHWAIREARYIRLSTIILHDKVVAFSEFLNIRRHFNHKNYAQKVEIVEYVTDCSRGMGGRWDAESQKKTLPRAWCLSSGGIVLGPGATTESFLVNCE